MYRTQQRLDDGLWEGIKRLFGGGDKDKGRTRDRDAEPEKGDEIVFERASGSKDYDTVESVFKNLTDKGRDYGVKVKGSKDNIVVPEENVQEVRDSKTNNTMKNRMYRVSDADKKNYKFTFKCSAAKEPSVYYKDKFESGYEYDDFKECKKAATVQGETFCKEMVEKYGLSKVFKADVSIYILEDGNWEWLDGVEVYPNEDGTYKIDDSKKDNTMKQIKDDAGSFESAVAAFESVYNDDNFKAYTDFYIHKEQDDAEHCNFEFAHPSSYFHISSGYSTGSTVVDNKLNKLYDEWFEEVLEEYQKSYPEENVYDLDNEHNWEAEEEVVQYMGENVGVWYDVDVDESREFDGVEITFGIYCGYNMRDDYASEVIMSESFDYGDTAGIKAFAQQIIDYIEGIQFD